MERFEPVEEVEEFRSTRTSYKKIGLVLLSLCCLGWIYWSKPGFVLWSAPSPRSHAVTRQSQDNWQYMPIPSPPVEDANAISKMAYPGYPQCQVRVEWVRRTWNKTQENLKYYTTNGVDGSTDSILNFLNQNGLYCPAARDVLKQMIRGVNVGGWLVLEPWLTPSLFEQFDPNVPNEQQIKDQWTFCEFLGKAECKRQLENHWDTWLTEEDVKAMAGGGINHVRIPVGYWIMGDIRPNEPWVNGDLRYLQRAMYWFREHGISVMFDLHCAPGSQNNFDNSGRAGNGIHWADPSFDHDNNMFYPNIDRTLAVLEALVSIFSLDPFQGVVKYVELVNEAFITIPLPVVKEFYTRGYAAIRNINPDIGIVIGDSFRFQEWNGFMYPPSYNHVYIDTHIYHVFDTFMLGKSRPQHIEFSCKTSLPLVAISPLSTIVGEWSLATTDCAKWLNGYGAGSRYDGTFQNNVPIGSCKGQNDIENKTVWTPEYEDFLYSFASAQIEAYESGSSMGWFFWNFKTERAPQWNYLLGLEKGWIPKVLKTSGRQSQCSSSSSSSSSNGQTLIQLNGQITTFPAQMAKRPHYPTRVINNNKKNE